mmetsp:Transcript_1888/g.5710  ORF Transcript_1888/g.5710 Transcript_1888/m.5710 type:complete len:308 (-) Transcript_1888:1556-2479(-)
MRIVAVGDNAAPNSSRMPLSAASKGPSPLPVMIFSLKNLSLLRVAPDGNVCTYSMSFLFGFDFEVISTTTTETRRTHETSPPGVSSVLFSSKTVSPFSISFNKSSMDFNPPFDDDDDDDGAKAVEHPVVFTIIVGRRRRGRWCGSSHSSDDDVPSPVGVVSRAGRGARRAIGRRRGERCIVRKDTGDRERRSAERQGVVRERAGGVRSRGSVRDESGVFDRDGLRERESSGIRRVAQKRRRRRKRVLEYDVEEREKESWRYFSRDSLVCWYARDAGRVRGGVSVLPRGVSSRRAAVRRPWRWRNKKE